MSFPVHVDDCVAQTDSVEKMLHVGQSVTVNHKGRVRSGAIECLHAGGCTLAVDNGYMLVEYAALDELTVWCHTWVEKERLERLHELALA